MDEAAEMLGRIHAMQQSISDSLDGFGGYLRCESCGTRRDLTAGDAGRYTSHGWPRCCNLTMRWWTQRQIDNGEDSCMTDPWQLTDEEAAELKRVGNGHLRAKKGTKALLEYVESLTASAYRAGQADAWDEAWDECLETCDYGEHPVLTNPFRLGDDRG